MVESWHWTKVFIVVSSQAKTETTTATEPHKCQSTIHKTIVFSYFLMKKLLTFVFCLLPDLSGST